MPQTLLKAENMFNKLNLSLPTQSSQFSGIDNQEPSDSRCEPG